MVTTGVHKFPASCKDGHTIAVRVRSDCDSVQITPFCELCHLIFLPSGGMAGEGARFLMMLVEEARHAPEASPKDYEGLYS